MAIKTDGSLYAWGDNSEGAVAEATFSDQLIPFSTGVQNVKYVDAGYGRSLAIIGDDNEVWAWGDNTVYTLGNDSIPSGSNSTVPVPVQVAYSHTFLKDAVAVASGSSHSVALTESGVVMAWGFNGDGELGQGHNKLRDYLGPDTGETIPFDPSKANPVSIPGRVVAIATGFNHTLALTDDGTVWAGRIAMEK